MLLGHDPFSSAPISSRFFPNVYVKAMAAVSSGVASLKKKIVVAAKRAVATSTAYLTKVRRLLAGMLAYVGWSARIKQDVRKRLVVQSSVLVWRVRQLFRMSRVVSTAFASKIRRIIFATRRVTVGSAAMLAKMKKMYRSLSVAVMVQVYTRRVFAVLRRAQSLGAFPVRIRRVNKNLGAVVTSVAAQIRGYLRRMAVAVSSTASLTRFAALRLRSVAVAATNIRRNIRKAFSTASVGAAYRIRRVSMARAVAVSSTAFLFKTFFQSLQANSTGIALFLSRNYGKMLRAASVATAYLESLISRFPRPNPAYTIKLKARIRDIDLWQRVRAFKLFNRIRKIRVPRL